jgi:hypothetical protein
MPVPKARLTRRTILTTLRRNRELLDKYAVRRIGLFGSFASGRQTERSDIDFVVEFDRPTYDNFIGLSRELEKLFGKRVDILTPEGLESIRVRSVADSIRKSLAYV